MRCQRQSFFRKLTIIPLLCLLPTTSLAQDEKWPSDCSFMADAGEPLHGVLKRLTGSELPIVVPKLYFGGPIYPRDGFIGADGTLFFFMHRETPAPYPVKGMTAKLQRGVQDWLSVLIYDYVSLDNSVYASMSTYTLAGRKGEDVSFSPYPFDLHRFNIPEEQNLRRIDLFFAGDSNNKTDVIHCGRRGPYGANNPQCEQTTFLQGVKLQFSYSRRYLGEWKSMKSNVSRLIKCIVQDRRN